MKKKARSLRPAVRRFVQIISVELVLMKICTSHYSNRNNYAAKKKNDTEIIMMKNKKEEKDTGLRQPSDRSTGCRIAASDPQQGTDDRRGLLE